MVDVSGRRKYSGIAAVYVDKGPGELTVHLYSNPVVSTANISIYTPKQSAATIVLTDQTGRQISNRRIILGEGTNIVTLPEIAGLSKGVYYISIIAGERKIIKMMRE